MCFNNRPVEQRVFVPGALAENHRFDLVAEISSIFTRLMTAERGEVPATVTTAQPMDDKQRKDVSAALKKFVKANEKVMLEEKVSGPKTVGLTPSWALIVATRGVRNEHLSSN